MEKEYIEVKIPILNNVEEMEVVKTFSQEQLWYVCAIAKAYEKSETQLKKKQEIINRLKELNLMINDSDYIYSQDEITSKNLELLQMLDEEV